MANISKLDITGYTKYLPTQYGESSKLIKLLSIYLQQIQQLEDSNVDLDKYSTNIPLAFGYQLDIIGKLLGVYRQSRTDEQYRIAIYDKIALNIGNGTPENCIQYLSSTTSASNINYWEHYPASIIMETNGNTNLTSMTSPLGNITMAGVSVGGVIASESGEVFRGCDVSHAYDNRIVVVSSYPELELMGEDMECGNPLAELGNVGYTGFFAVEDSDPLSRCIFPDLAELTDDSNKYFGFLGNFLSDSFGDLNDSTVGARFRSLLEAPQYETTQGIFADVYTK